LPKFVFGKRKLLLDWNGQQQQGGGGGISTVWNGIKAKSSVSLYFWASLFTEVPICSSPFQPLNYVCALFWPQFGFGWFIGLSLYLICPMNSSIALQQQSK
jgi:hypothetical protein